MIKVFSSVDHCRASYLAAVIVDEYVAHDGENPSLEVYVVNIFRFVVKNLESCVLHEVLSCFSVGCQLEAKLRRLPCNPRSLSLNDPESAIVV